MKLGSISSIDPFEVKSRSSGEVFTICRTLASAENFGGTDITFEELRPGHRASARHRHSSKNELSIVIAGQVVVHFDDEQAVLNAGDYVLFGGGESHFHFVENRSDSPATILSISSNHGDDVVEYSRNLEHVC